MTRPNLRKAKDEFDREWQTLSKRTNSWIKNTCTVDNLKRTFPISIWLPKYRARHLLGDVIAGLTVALVIIPQSLALAQIAHLPPHYGLYSGFMCCFVYAIFGSSKEVSLGLSPVMAILAFKFCETPVPGNGTYVAILSMMTGCLELFMAMFHIGYIPKFISWPVLSGFLSAVGIIMIWTQVKVISDIPDLPREFAFSIHEICRRISETNYWNVIVAAVCVVVMLILKKLMEVGEKMSKNTTEDTTRSKRVMITLMTLVGTARYAIVVIASAATAAGLLANNSTQIDTITIVGEVDLEPGLPEWKVPALTLEYDNTTVSTGAIYKRMGGGMFTMPLVSVLEGLVIAKLLAYKNNYKIDTNQEVLTLGIANLLGCFVGAIPISASMSSSLTNSKAGAQTQAAQVITGAVVLLILGTLTPYIYYIPTAALGAIIMTEVSGLVDIFAVVKMWKSKKADLFPYFAIFLLAVFEDIEVGIVTGIGLSLGIILISQAHPKIAVRHEKLGDNFDHHHVGHDEGITSLTTYRDIAVFTPPGGLYFPSVEALHDRILDEVHEGNYNLHGNQATKDYSTVPKPTVYGSCSGIVIDFTHVYTIDTTGIHYVLSWHADLSSRHVHVVYAGLKEHRTVENALLKFEIKDFKQAPTIDAACQVIRDLVTEHTPQHSPELRINMGDNLARNATDTTMC